MIKSELLEEQNKKENRFSLHPIVVEILFRRGIKTEAEVESFMCPNYEKDTADPFLLSGIKEAVERIAVAREKKENVLIFGDYDADGITASLVLKQALSWMGIEAQSYIPNKELEGYGMNLMAVEKFSKEGVNLIISVDCGISSIVEVARAKELGMDVIITDHHYVPEKIPLADAVVNPKLKNNAGDFGDLAGVGVAFKLAQALCEKLLPEKKEQLKWLLDLVAIGTVADCVSLTGENRMLVKYGLVVLSKTRRAGLLELFKVGRIRIDEDNFPDAQKISFQIAPRINAAGRMDHAKIAFDLLLEDDRVKAREMALEVEAHNQSRQKITKQIVEEVIAEAEEKFKDKKFIFARSEHFPLGIVGLAAGRVADKFNKPTAVFKKEKQTSSGSFRSISQLDIIEVIQECSEFLEKFGGHSQAAGVTVKNENFEKFCEKLNSVIEKKLDGADISPELEIDVELSFEDIGFKLSDEIKKMEPFGQGNREPVFSARNFIVQDLKWVGNGEKHLKLFLRPDDGSPRIFEAIGFSVPEEFRRLKQGDKVDIAFNLGQDEWNGSKKLQLRIIDLKIL